MDRLICSEIMQMKLRDAPVGLFYSADGELCLKTAYSYPWGTDAYVVRTGEVFWGTAVDADERGNLDVTPVPIDTIKAENRRKKQRKYYRMCGVCGWRFEQSMMIRTNKSPNGWMCKICSSKSWITPVRR